MRPVTILPPVRRARPRWHLPARLHARLVARVAADVLGFILFVGILVFTGLCFILPEDVLIDLFNVGR